MPRSNGEALTARNKAQYKRLEIHSKTGYPKETKSVAIAAWCLLGNRAARADRGVQGVRRSNTQTNLADPSQEGLQSNADLRVEIAAEQFDTKRIEGVDVFIKALLWEIGVSVNDVHHYWTPGHYVAVLCLFVETDETADDIRAESKPELVLTSMISRGGGK